MTNTLIADCKANLEFELARIEREIRNKRHDIDCLREELSDLEIEYQTLLEQLQETAI
jgi:chromosome segregation ATPase